MGLAQINESRLYEVLRRIWLASLTGQYPFDNYRMPQECRNLPCNLSGPKEHAMFLFRALSWMQGGNKTEPSFQGLKKMYEACPEMFSPEEVHTYDLVDLRNAIKSAGLTHYNVRPPWWQHNSRILLDYWDGDPRNILQDMPEDPDAYWEEALRRITQEPHKIMGAQEKIAALFIDLLADARLIPIVNTPPAIDIRVSRVLGSTESVWGGDTIGPWKELNAFRSACRAGFRLFSKDHGIPMNDIGNAVWFFGGEMCAGATARHLGKGVMPKKDLDELCGSCFLSDLCNWIAPAGKHYRGAGGIQFLSRERIPGEVPLKLDESAPTIGGRCRRHQGLWTPDNPGECRGCGGCDMTM